MSTERPDVIEVLEKEKTYHLEQVKKINLALAALKGETASPSETEQPRQSLPWAAKIDELFDSTDEWMTLEEVREKLAEMGIPEALEKDYRNTVYSTLHRKATKKGGTLDKDEDGRYRKRQQKKSSDTVEMVRVSKKEINKIIGATEPEKGSDAPTE